MNLMMDMKYYEITTATSIKKIFIIVFLSLFLFSCEKDYLIAGNEVPEWLKVKIAQDENSIQSTPRSALVVGAWIRYEYQNNYYFEYHNLASSAWPLVYDYAGNKIKIDQEPYLNYYNDKCCEQYVWKGPAYFE